MLQYSSKNTNNVFTQSIVELCECCGETEGTVHISEVMSKPDHLASIPFKIKDASNNDYTLKLKKDRKKEIQVERMAKGMVSASGTTTESLRYGLRSERMCSSSVVAGVEYCYRLVDNEATESFARSPRAAEFKAKYENQFRDKPLEEPSGYKLGMDRSGNPVRIQSESFEKIDANGEVVEEFKYYGAHKKEWYRELAVEEKLLTITSSLSKAESTKIEDYKYKKSFELNTTSSYYVNANSLGFDGTNDSILLTGTNDMHFSKDDFDDHGVTISAWLYIEASGSTSDPIVYIGRNHNRYYGYGIRISADFRFAMDYYGLHNGTNGQSANHRRTRVQSNTVAPSRMYEQQWVHVVAVYGTSNSDDWKLYLNGKQLQSTIVSGNADVTLTYRGNNSNIGRLGRYSQNTDNYLFGIINHVGIWKTILSEKSVAGMYNDGSPPYLLSGSAGYVETGSNQLSGYWALDEGEGTSVRNIGYAENSHGTLMNGPVWTTTSPVIG